MQVEDSGIGMTEHFVKHHLFVPHRQGNSFSPGVGLGMSVLEHMTSCIHGDLSISSKVRKSTTVNVGLTLDASEHSDDGLPVDLQKILSRIKGNYLVLLDINKICDDKQEGAVMRRAKAVQSVVTDWLGSRVSTSNDINVDGKSRYELITRNLTHSHFRRRFLSIQRASPGRGYPEMPPKGCQRALR